MLMISQPSKWVNTEQIKLWVIMMGNIQAQKNRPKAVFSKQRILTCCLGC